MPGIEQYDLSDEDREKIIGSTLITSQVKHVKAEPTLEQQIEREAENKRQSRREKQYAQQIQEKLDINKRVEQDLWLLHTQGRPLPQEGEVFFSNPQPCPIGCKALIVRPLSGYNPNRGTMGFDVNIDYNEDHTRHICQSDDPNESIRFLTTKVTQLEDLLRHMDNTIDEKIRHAAFVTATGR